MNLLIADDEVAIRRGMLSLPWQTIGIEKVFEAENGVTAKEILLAEQIDIIISDIRMPGFSGLELAEYVKDCHMDASIILLTGFSEFEYAQRAIKNNVADYFLKPIRPRKILETVSGVKGQLEKKRYLNTFAHNYEQSVDSLDYQEQFACLFEDVGSSCMEILCDLGQNYKNDISLNSMADKYHFSVAYLSRMIKKETGYCFSDLLTGIRLAEAVRCLQNDTVKIGLVCEKAGFRDARYFSQAFKKTFGCSPNEFRKNADAKKKYSLKEIMELL